MGITISERIGSQEELYRILCDNMANNLRVAMPGIIQTFDPVTQTATIQPAIKEKIRDENLNVSWSTLPILQDVPVVMQRAGDYVVTMPIKAGDECLVIFADMCIDNWFSNGGVREQAEKRRHDLSDGFAIMGVWSQPRKITDYSINSMQLRNLSGTTYIDIGSDGINLVGNVMKNGTPL